MRRIERSLALAPFGTDEGRCEKDGTGRGCGAATPRGDMNCDGALELYLRTAVRRPGGLNCVGRKCIVLRVSALEPGNRCFLDGTLSSGRSKWRAANYSESSS
jgi:hypothetical protein